MGGKDEVLMDTEQVVGSEQTVVNVDELNGHHDDRLEKERERLEQQRGTFNKRCYQDGLPCINLSGSMPLRDVSQKGVEALLARHQREPFLYQRMGKLVNIVTKDYERPDGTTTQKTVIEEVSADILRGMLSRSANFIRGINHVDPPMSNVNDILAMGTWPFPVITGVVEVPTLRRDGTILDTPGYDSDTQLVYIPSQDLEIPAVPASPTQQDAKDAINVLLEAIGDFPYESDTHKANAIAGIITPVIRPALRGHIPLQLIDATRQGTGKTLLAEVQAYIATGRKGALKTAPDSEAEWRKTITTTMREGSAVNIIDNVRAKLDSASLDALLTSYYWSDRLLGTNKSGEYPNKGTWTATGNNITIGGDLPRRCYLVRLDAGTAKPWQRTGPVFDLYDEDEFPTHMAVVDHTFIDLETWLPENRGRLVAAILTIARAWYVAGKPQAPSLPTFGSFEDWTRTLGGMLHYAGVRDFLGNLDAFQEDADYDTRQWAGFLHALSERFGKGEFKATDIANTINLFEKEELALGYSQPIPADVSARKVYDHAPDYILNAKPSSRKTIIGIAFNKRQGTVFDDSGLCLKRNYDSHSKVSMWQVVTKQLRVVQKAP
jgi:hypothetical protein